MKKLFVVLLMLSNFAFAESGQPRVAFEYEHETSKNGGNNIAFSMYPGIQWKEGWLNRAELMLEGNQDNMYDNGKTGNNTQTKMGVRLRTDFKLGAGFSGYVRGLVGRAMSNEENYDYVYLEPAIKYSFNNTWSWTVSDRIIRTMDGTDGKDVNKLRFGPNWEINKNNVLELRYALVYYADSHNILNPNNGARKADAWILEYAYKF
jgi:hypothetical protein